MPRLPKNNSCFLFLFSICTPFPVHADPVTLERVFESVRNSYPKIQMQIQKKEEADARAQSARGALDLALDAGAETQPLGYYKNSEYYLRLRQPTTLWGTTFHGGWRSGRGDFAPYDGKRVTGTGGELSAGLTIPLLRGGWTDSRRAKIEKAQTGIRYADHGVSTEQLLSLRNAGLKYWKWVEAVRQVEIARELLSTARERESWVKRKVKAGALAALQEVENQRIILDRQNKLIEREREERGAALELSLYLRDKEGTPLIADFDSAPRTFPEPKAIDPAEVTGLKERAFKFRPELSQLAAKLDGIAVMEGLSQNELLPQLDVFGEVARDLGATDPTRSPTDFRAGLKVSIPLERRVAKGDLSAARAQRQRVEAEIGFLREQISVEIDYLMTNLQAVSSQVSLAEAEVSANEALVSGEKTRFQMGDSQIFLVNMRELALGDSRVKLVKAMVLYQIYLIEMGVATGELGNL